MISDLEARLRRLEHVFAAINLDAVYTVPQALGLNAQTLAALAGSGSTYTGGGEGVWSDCGITLPKTLTANFRWGMNFEFNATMDLSWDPSNQWWGGCAVLHWPGLCHIWPDIAGDPGQDVYFDNIACDSPVWMTLSPVQDSQGAGGSGYELSISLLMGTVSIPAYGADISFTASVAGSCSDEPSLWPAPIANVLGHWCDPWLIAFNGGEMGGGVGVGAPAGFPEPFNTSTWHFYGTITIPDAP